MQRFRGRFLAFLFVTTLLVGAGSTLCAQESTERILFHGKVFTGDPQNPYAEAVGIRGEKIAAVGTLSEVAGAVSAGAERIDMEGKSLFPGFIDSHSHSIDGGMSLISAGASEKVGALKDLPAFAAEAK